MSNSRAVKYRRLALAESDQEKARLLHQLADESDRGVLCTADWLSTRRYGDGFATGARMRITGAVDAPP